MEPFNYYNQESAQYSRKRYEGVIDTYVKYFFKRRLALILNYLKHLADGPLSERQGGLILLDVGCADGVVLREIARELPDRFNKLVGVDIAENMIKQARALTKESNIKFFNKSETPHEKFDVVLIVGFMTEPLWQSEKNYIFEHLVPGGTVIVSLAGRNSLHAGIKLKDKEYVRDYRSYQEYEWMLENDFEIVSKKHYGFFVPKLWSLPFLARFIQPTTDILLASFFPELFHEVLYLLRRKTS